MATRLDIKDVPQAELDRVREAFESAPQVRQMRIRQNLLQRQGDYRAAMNVGRQIETLYTKTVEELLTEVDRQSENIDMQSVSIPKGDADTLNEIIVTLQMAIDIMDTCVMDFNDVLHRTDTSLTLEMFDELRQLSDKVKAHLRYFQKNSRLFNEIVFADKSDNMYKLLRNKARSLINKNDKSRR